MEYVLYEGDVSTDENPMVQDDEEYRIMLLSACFVDDAKESRRMYRREDTSSMKTARVYYSHFVQWIYRLVIVLHMLLAFFEPPTTWSFVSPTAVLLLEIVIIMAYVSEFLILQRTWEVWLICPWNKMFLVVVILCSLDILMYACGVPFRWSRFLRPAILAWHFPSLRLSTIHIRKTLPDITFVLILLGIVIFLYAVFCRMLYRGREEGESYFGNMTDATFSLFVCLTTANFPDVMMPAYKADKSNALVFITYLIITLFILMNLVLAVVYNQYQKYLKAGVIANAQLREALLKKAFKLLVGDDCDSLGLSKWAEFMRILRPHYTREKIDILYYSLENSDGVITEHEFLGLVHILNLRVRVSSVVCKFVVSQHFEHFIDCMIIMAFVYSTVTVYEDPNSGGGTLSIVDYTILGLFIVEMLLKIYALGFVQYIRVPWNAFDFSVTLLGIYAVIMISMGARGTRVLIVVVGLRILRIVRVIGKLKQYDVILAAVGQLIPILLIYGAIQFCVFYFFAMLGMELFGGKISEGNPKLKALGWDKTFYYLNSFNDFGSSLVTLFELMVVNNWHIITAGYVAVTTEWARLFFVMFYIFSVVVILNIVVAFILEAFVLQWGVLQKQDDKGECDKRAFRGPKSLSEEDEELVMNKGTAVYERFRMWSVWRATRKKKIGMILETLYKEQ